MKRNLILIIISFTVLSLFSQKKEYQIFLQSTIIKGKTSEPTYKYILAYKTSDYFHLGENMKYKLSFLKKEITGMEVSELYKAIDNNDQLCFIQFTNNPSEKVDMQDMIVIWYEAHDIIYHYFSLPPVERK